MKKAFLFMALLMLESTMVSAQDYYRYDTNNDGKVTIADVTALVDYILGKSQNEYECVDLGLPSGTLWATCNIGASKPEEYGDYFAWGEIVPYGKEDWSNDNNYQYNNNGSYVKNRFIWDTYKYLHVGDYKMTKYCSKSEYGYNGFTDTLTELELSDDAAYTNWGQAWRMPTRTQCQELLNSDYTTQVWTTMNGVSGCKITSRMSGYTDKYIFLPASRFTSREESNNTGAYYWSRTLIKGDPKNVSGMLIRSSGSPGTTALYRCDAFSVRPVRNK